MTRERPHDKGPSPFSGTRAIEDAAVAFVMGVCRSAMASLRTDGAGSPAPPALPVTRLAADVLAEKALPPRLADILALQGFLLGVNLSACPASFLMMATASFLMSAWELGWTGAGLAGATTGTEMGKCKVLAAGTLDSTMLWTKREGASTRSMAPNTSRHKGGRLGNSQNGTTRFMRRSMGKKNHPSDRRESNKGGLRWKRFTP